MSHKNKALQCLTSAALALPGIQAVNAEQGGHQLAQEYSYYTENDERMTVQAYQATFDMAISEETKLGFSVVHDVVSGASPMLNVPPLVEGDKPEQILSGASIREDRLAVNANVAHQWADKDINVSIGTSSEDDYVSVSGGIQTNWQFNQKNTTLSAGFSLSDDQLMPTGYNFEENKHSSHYLLGISQVLSQKSLLQLNLTHSRSSGYLSDPYKKVFIEGTGLRNDVRPDQRQSYALMGRFSHYLSDYKASIQTDYRYYHDDWDIRAHTLEIRFEKELDKGLSLTPWIRYYSQDAARFYQPWFRQNPADGLHSSDYRLAPYGALSGGLKINKQLSDSTSIKARFEYYDSGSHYRLGGTEQTLPDPLSFYTVSVGLNINF